MKRTRSTGWTLGLALIVVVGVLVLLTWGNLNYARQNPGGNDFLVHWEGTRSFLIDNLSPYSDQTALRIQTLAYGGPAGPGQHELRVAYPLYSIILFFPFAFISDFAVARAVWMTVLEVGLLLISIFSIQAAGWKPRFPTLLVFLLFSFLWYQAVRPVINGNAVIIVTLGIVGALVAIRNGSDEVAGILLAFTTIKPQVVAVFLVFIVLWSLFNRRWRLIAWLVGTLLLLSAVAWFFLPDWILQNLREIVRYPGYNPPGTPGAALAVWFPAMGQRIGLGLTAVLMVVLLFEWFIGRKADYRGFLWLASLTLVASQWIGIQTDPGNFIVVLPALVLCFALIEERYRHQGWVISLLIMLALGVGLWVLFVQTLVISNGQPQQSPVMFFPLPAFLFLLLYWVRWWAFHPGSVWYDLVFDRENPRRR